MSAARHAEESDVMAAAGIASYALMIELLITLVEQGVVDGATFLGTIDQALVSVENIDTNSPALRLARELLWTQFVESAASADKDAGQQPA